MLTAAEVQGRRRRRPPPSMKQLYQEYVLQRIEAYKNSLTRDQLLKLGDEAIDEMRASAEEQFVLTKAVVSNGPSSRRPAPWSSWCSFRCRFWS